MNKENEIKSGFAEDHASQRRRRLTAATKEQLEQEIRRLQEVWRSEILNAHLPSYSYHGTKRDDLETWKREALAKTLKFPNPPKPSNRNQYQLVFLPLQFGNGSADKVHLDDYSDFYSFIRNSAA